MAFSWMHTFPSDDASTITASTEDADYPVENLQDPRLSVPWKTGITQAAETVTLDLGAAYSIAGVGIIDHDLTSGDSAIQLLGNDSDAWGSPAFTRNLTYAADNIVEIFTAESYRYWRFAFTKASAGVSRSIGRLLLALRSPMAIGAAPGFTIKYGDTSQAKMTRGGVLYSDVGVQLRQVEFDFHALEEADADIVRASFAAAGLHTPLLVHWTVADEEDAELIVYGAFAGAPSFKHVGPGLRWDTGVTLEEVA